MKQNKNIKNKLSNIDKNIKKYITLKRYLYGLLFISLLFLAVGEIKNSFIYILFALLGLIYHDKLKEDINNG